MVRASGVYIYGSEQAGELYTVRIQQGVEYRE
jgi:hypothetical protein